MVFSFWESKMAGFSHPRIKGLRKRYTMSLPSFNRNPPPRNRQTRHFRKRDWLELLFILILKLWFLEDLSWIASRVLECCYFFSHCVSCQSEIWHFWQWVRCKNRWSVVGERKIIRFNSKRKWMKTIELNIIIIIIVIKNICYFNHHYHYYHYNYYDYY